VTALQKRKLLEKTKLRLMIELVTKQIALAAIHYARENTN
jgi:hypothetical protein